MAGLSYRRTKKFIARIRERDGDNCWLCGERVGKNTRGQRRGTLDHVVPKKFDGPNSISNLRLAHKECNEARGHQPPGDYIRIVRQTGASPEKV